MAYGFHSTFGESITPLQFARVLAFNRSHNVKPWSLVQMLAARQEAARSGVTDRTASLEDICQTLEFGAPAKEPQPGTLAAEQEERRESGELPGWACSWLEDCIPNRDSPGGVHTCTKHQWPCDTLSNGVSETLPVSTPAA